MTYTQAEIKENLKNFDEPGNQTRLDETLRLVNKDAPYASFLHEFAASQGLDLKSPTLLTDAKQRIRKLTERGNLPELYDE